MAYIITALIDPVTGEVEMDINGAKGVGCHAIQDAFTKALGGEVIVDRKKPEYNAKVTKANCVTR